MDMPKKKKKVQENNMAKKSLKPKVSMHPIFNFTRRTIITKIEKLNFWSGDIPHAGVDKQYSRQLFNNIKILLKNNIKFFNIIKKLT
jgi:hypothetical protein